MLPSPTMSPPTPDDDINAVRKRPGMFVGDPSDGSGLLQMVWEVVANAIDEHLAGAALRISISIAADGSIAVEDDGRGFPFHLVDGVPFVERTLTRLHDTPTLDGHRPHEHLGPLGVGMMPVNALSTSLVVEIHRDGRLRRQRFSRGRKETELEDIESSGRTGTRVTFSPDPEIFGADWIDVAAIARRLRELACLLPAITFSLVDQREEVFSDSGGLRTLASMHRRRGFHAPAQYGFEIDGVFGDVRVDVALEWGGDSDPTIQSYANLIETSEGGTHADGLVDGLTLGLLEALGVGASTWSLGDARDAVSRGLFAVLRVRLDHLDFDRPTREHLATPLAGRAVENVVRAAFARRLRDDTALRAELVSRLGAQREE